MSASSSSRRGHAVSVAPTPPDAVLSDSIADLLVAGVVVELDAGEAEASARSKRRRSTKPTHGMPTRTSSRDEAGHGG